ncbi:suppressor of fused domain protein [Hymenobacter cellulosivorans]|uniref:Suppressor of fused domain protein n=1 Tax=Hymenobacter cellulosivorans TaxID=2932249 RepID=A0ABY4FGV7_9BACT|nr:suppressor of fused domain protein [Hymenobacter cellulosivorans]UOQ53696.1 suppressor of fused domain protein [Hymenobacter cellulosivorans]
MTEQDPEPEKTASGAPVYRYEEVEPAPFSLAAGDEATIEAISDHIEQHVGKISSVFHEIISDKVHLDVHIVEPSKDFPFYTLVTSGMSDLPMTVPEGEEDARYAELCILLPSTWPMAENGDVVGVSEDDDAYWPIGWMKFLARFPHEYHTWLGVGHTIPNGEEAAPYASNTKLGCMLVLPSISLPKEFRELKISEDKTINFYCLYCLYPEEMQLKMDKGLDALLDKFEEYGMSDVLDIARPNVVSKKGFLGLW